MTKDEMMERLLDVHRATLALFDAVEGGGPQAVLDDPGLLISWLTPIRQVEEEFRRRNIQQLIALGVSPASLLKLADGGIEDLQQVIEDGSFRRD